MPLAVGGLTKTSFPLTNSVMNSREYQLAHFTIGLSRPRLHDPSSTVGPQPSRNTRDIIAHELFLGLPRCFLLPVIHALCYAELPWRHEITRVHARRLWLQIGTTYAGDLHAVIENCHGATKLHGRRPEEVRQRHVRRMNTFKSSR